MTARRLLVAALVLVATIVLASTNHSAGAPKNRAGLIVRHGDGNVERICVLFDEPTISGLELLERSEVRFVAERSALGAAMCKIDGEGCDHPSQDCFCRYPTFWGYWTHDDGGWRFSEVGASDHEVKDGSIAGWSWGRDGKPAPPDTSLAKVCPAGESRGTSTLAKAVETSSSPALAGPRSTSTRPNYAAFGAFGLLFAALVGVLLLRRRRI